MSRQQVRKGVLGTLFLLALLLMFAGSFIWHLPSAWIWKNWGTPFAEKAPYTLAEFSGNWPEGGLWVHERQQNFPLAMVNWRINSGSLLMGQPSVQWRWVDFYHSAESLRGQAQYAIWNQTLKVSQINGRVGLPTLGVWLQPWDQMGLLGGALGQLKLTNLNAQVPLKETQPWPQNTQGKIEIKQLDVMGVQIPKLTATLSQTSAKAQAPIQINIKGGDAQAGWRLEGTITLQANHQYQGKVTLQAKQGGKLPDWSALFMRQVSPKQAVWQQQGRW